MSSVLGSQLSRLYRDYYAGRLEFGDYRHRRSLLLNSLSPGGADAEADLVTQPRAAATLDPVEESAPKEVAPQGDRRSFSLVTVVAICVVVVIAVVLIVVTQLDQPEFEASTVSPESEPAELPYSVPEVQETEISRTPEIGQTLVEEFIFRRDYRLLSLQEFRDSWDRIAKSDRIVAKGTVWFQPMAQGLQEQIDEAQALAVDPDNDQLLDQLYEFSLVLGLIELVPPGWVPSADSSITAGATAAAVDTPTPVDRQKPVPETEETNSATPEKAVAALPQAVDNEATENLANDAEVIMPATASAAATVQTGAAGNCSTDLLKKRRQTCYDFVTSGQKGPTMRVLPGGAFVMGSDKEGDSNPRREAEISGAFAISVFEISRSEYELFCRSSSYECSEDPWSSGDMPMVNVSWNDASAYVVWLSAITGQSYRLPREDEWEYAARAGSTSDFPFGDTLLPSQARYSAIHTFDRPLPKSDQTTQRNTFGLWHMVGNVQEWVADRWNSVYSEGNGENNTVIPGGGELRVVRGGSYADKAAGLRSSARVPLEANERNKTTGFRIVRDF